MRRIAVLLALLPVAACGRDERSVLAWGAGHELTVNDAVALLADGGLPNQPEVVYALGDFWVDYVLLATAVAEDPSLGQLELSRIVDQQLEQELILALRDTAVDPDTTVSEEELEQRFAQVAPGSQIRARHILLTFPDGGGPQVRDSIRAFAESLRARVASGESFEQLALEYSADRGSAVDGGDLGWFGHNELVRPLEEAAFSLEPGQISGVVESPWGLHILRVDDRQVPTLDEAIPQVRAFIQQERVQAAESALVASVEEGAGVEVVAGAADLVRRIAEDPSLRLSRRARNRPLVSYRGGRLTVGELVAFMQSRPPQFRLEVLQIPDEAIEQNLLVGLAHRELLVARARERGLEPSRERADSLATELRQRLVEVARDLDLVDIPVRAGESQRTARERRVEELLRQMVREQREVVPLGSFSYILRDQYGGRVHHASVDRAVLRIAEIRGPEPTPGMPRDVPEIPLLEGLPGIPGPDDEPGPALPPGGSP